MCATFLLVNVITNNVLMRTLWLQNQFFKATGHASLRSCWGDGRKGFLRRFRDSLGKGFVCWCGVEGREGGMLLLIRNLYTVACNCSCLVKDSEDFGIFIVFVLFLLSFFCLFVCLFVCFSFPDRTFAHHLLRDYWAD
jgi:hypothetical protein